MPRTQSITSHAITCWAHNIIIITSNIYEYMSDIFTICPPLRIWLLLFHFVLWIFCAGRHSLLLPEMSGKLTGLIYLNWQLMRFYNVIISFVHTSSDPLSPPSIHLDMAPSLTDRPCLSPVVLDHHHPRLLRSVPCCCCWYSYSSLPEDF